MEGAFTFHSVYSAVLDVDKSMGLHWMPVTLEPLPDAEQPLEDSNDKDPRQIYMQYIFHPGRFPVHVIRKALSVKQFTLTLQYFQNNCCHCRFTKNLLYSVMSIFQFHF